MLESQSEAETWKGRGHRMKPRAKTMMERQGFLDEELRTPKHDEIMLWLDENIDRIVADLFPPEWTASERRSYERVMEKERFLWLQKVGDAPRLTEESAKHVRLLKAEIAHWRSHGDAEKERHFTDQLESFLQSLSTHWPDPGPPPPRPSIQIEKKRWEFPIMDGSHIVGYVDYCISVEFSDFYLDGLDRPGAYAPIWKRSRQPLSLMFEAKTAIRSLGDLLRQINTYRTYARDSRFYVVAPDDRFRQQIESQGIGFVKYA